MASDFGRFTAKDVRALLQEYPLAWVVPLSGPASAACLLPLLGDYAEDGSLSALVGHMSRRNALLGAVSTDSRVLVLVSGPHAYVSPAHAGRRDWGPTWNFAQLVIEAEADILPDTTEQALEQLVEAMEADFTDPWRPSELGDRYAEMSRAVVGFRLRVTGVTGRFKLGQDEQPEVFASIVASHPNEALVGWMRRFEAEE